MANITFSTHTVKLYQVDIAEVLHKRDYDEDTQLRCTFQYKGCEIFIPSEIITQAASIQKALKVRINCKINSDCQIVSGAVALQKNEVSSEIEKNLVSFTLEALLYYDPYSDAFRILVE